MTEKADTWMAFYLGAYLTNTLHLTRCQHGSYLMLILAAFKNTGWLPNDDAALAAIAKCSPKEWKAERAIYAAFFEVTADRWTHAKVTKEWEKAQAMTAQRKAAGKGSAAKRERERLEREAQRQAQRDGNDRSTAVAPPLNGKFKPLPSPSPDLTTTSSVSSGAQATARESELPDGWMPSEADILEIRRERPDLVGELFDRRQRDFRDWCASKAITSFDWGATWRTFMRQTHGQASARSVGRAEGPAAPREALQLTGPRGIWYVRLTSHRPGKAWPAAHGPAPESDQENPNLNDDQRRQWRRFHGLPPDWRARAAA